jgi:hypothetical protein
LLQPDFSPQDDFFSWQQEDVVVQPAEAGFSGLMALLSSAWDATAKAERARARISFFIVGIIGISESDNQEKNAFKAYSRVPLSTT